MATSFCTNCGAQMAEGAAFCTSCGAPSAAAPPAQHAAAPPAAAPAPHPQQPYGAPPPPMAASTGTPGGMSQKTMIGIAVAIVLAIIIAYFVQQNERQFQRNRRAGQAPATSSTPVAPTTPGQQGAAPASTPYGGFNSGGPVGSEQWIRNQLLGRWATRDCTNTVEFRADGTTYSTDGTNSLPGTWVLQHPRVTVVEQGTTTVFEIVQMGDLEMVTELANRRRLTWRRCP